jgi:hypothetical protein
MRDLSDAEASLQPSDTINIRQARGCTSRKTFFSVRARRTRCSVLHLRRVLVNRSRLSRGAGVMVS